MKIAIGCDHAGFKVKQAIISYLCENGYEYQDFGTYDESSCDYPDFADALCKKIMSGEYERGILICGTGIGMSMAANKHKGIRAACCENTFSARMTRMHNNANVLCFGERVIGYGLACDIVDQFVDTEFEGGRHQARVDDINALDEGK